MEDLIRRSDAINAVIEWYGCKPNDIEAFEKIIESVPSADRPQEWIPCSERLPEYGVPVLTWDGSMCAVEQRIPFTIDDDFNRIYSEWWVDADFDEDYEDAGYYPNLRDGAAVAWMPLPSAYQGE